MKIICNTLNPELHEDLMKQGVKFASLDKVLSNADIITINIPLTEENKNLISKEKIRLMKKTATFINTSRGELVDMTELIKYANENKTFNVGLDIDAENYKDILNIKRNNVIVTPHIAGVTNEAVEKIIEIAKKNEKTYIMAIGAITNIALAIKKAPDIIEKIEIIWLGGHSPICNNNKEFNFRQDVQAIKEIFESKVKLTIIPCKGVESNLKISIYELEHYLKGKSELCNYLCSRFYDDEIHGIQTRRVIWDISVIAYLINKEWFEEKKMDCPEINRDLSYSFNKNDRKIKFVTYLDSDKIYNDLFNKLAEKGYSIY